MKKVIIILALSFPHLCFAHEDRFFTYSYKNVTVRFVTGFFYEEIENAKIIGQYASMLCDTLAYDEPVLLDFIHDYSHFYQGANISLINIGSESYNQISYYEPRFDSIYNQDVNYPVPIRNIDKHDPKIIEKHIYNVTPINSTEKIVLRQFGFHFKADHTLKLLHHAIINKTDVIAETRIDSLEGYLENMYYRLESIPQSIILPIQEESIPIISKILNRKVYKEVDSMDHHILYYSYFSQDNRYYPYAGIHDEEIVLDTLDQIYSFNFNDGYAQPLFIFETPQSLRRYYSWSHDQEFQKSKIHKIPVEANKIIETIDIEWLGDDLFLIKYLAYKGPRFLYLIYNDTLITDFESYIDSYRDNEE